MLADPATLGPDVKVWARLQDGTPLVTARKRGEGQIVLFHVTANSDWSNLPLSGLFVEMLRRIATLGKLGGADGGDVGAATASRGRRAGDAPTCWRRCRRSTASALLRAAAADRAGRSPPPRSPTSSRALEHPPGYYGPAGAPRALNVLDAEEPMLKPLPALPPAPSGAPTRANAPSR